MPRRILLGGAALVLLVLAGGLALLLMSRSDAAPNGPPSIRGTITSVSLAIAGPGPGLQWRADGSDASGSSAGLFADHQRCVNAPVPPLVATSVVMSCGVWPGVSIKWIDGLSANPSAGRPFQTSPL